MKSGDKAFSTIVSGRGSAMMPSMLELVNEYGLLSLFLISFFASTLLPLGSEWFLVTLLLQGSDPFVTVIIATIGNTFGAATNYLVGYYGGHWLAKRLLRVNKTQLRRAESWFNRYGSWSLLLAWLPIIGDPLCLVSGILKTPIVRFTLLVTTGKGLRYSFLTLLTLRGAEMLF